MGSLRREYDGHDNIYLRLAHIGDALLGYPNTRRLLDPFVRASRRIAYNHYASILAEARSSVPAGCREILK
jgi:hypothetical protein